MDSGMKKQYSIIYYALAGLHLLYLSLFIISHSIALIYFNVASIFIYIALGATARYSRNLINHFLICFIEVLINVVLSSILCGMECGFSLILLAMLPLIFYSIHMLDKIGKSNSRVGLIDCSIVIFFYYLIWLFDYVGIGRRYELGNNLEHILYLINLSCTILILMGFLIVFVDKVKGEREALTHEKEEIENSANYDPLTGLLNRRSLDEYFEKAIGKVSAYESDFCILMCDIDNFKHVNDTYGHECGDEVLRNIASIIKKSIRSKDVAFRWGGEELLIMVHAKEHTAKDVAEKCRKGVEASVVTYEGQEIRVTITIGGASYYQGVTKNELVNKADEKLYIGKNNGKNQVVM